MKYGLQEWKFGWELGELRYSAVDNIGDRFAVREDCVALLLEKGPSA